MTATWTRHLIEAKVSAFVAGEGAALRAQTTPYEPYPLTWLNQRSASQLASDFRRDLRLWPLAVALFLERPDVQEVRSVVVTILPEPYSGEVEIVTDAIMIAFSPSAAERRAAEQRAARAVPGLILGNYPRRNGLF